MHFLKEGGFAASVHIHYIKSIGEKGFGLGLEYERIFDVHRHNTIGIVGNFKASERLSFSLSPGIAFEGGSGEGPWPALHFEALYEWEFGKIHIGPVAGVAYEVEDFHLSAGIHFGFGF
ncbi:MAG: hypothetical protein MUD02_09730 [Bacteroidales bacterium]|nr:hypothetical protein [Bacteroidales bacterium]MCU0409214.1 hypothetical protein [Bacteroidales bacterium]